MSTEYRTKRRKIVDAIVDKIKLINGQMCLTMLKEECCF